MEPRAVDTRNLSKFWGVNKLAPSPSLDEILKAFLALFNFLPLRGVCLGTSKEEIKLELTRFTYEAYMR